MENVKLYGSEFNNALINGEVHLGLNIASLAVPENMDFVSIQQIEWVCVCSPDSKFADMTIVDNELLITERQITCSSMLDNEQLTLANKISQETWEAFDQDDMLRLVEQDLGWAFLPKSMLDKRVSMGTLVQFKPEFNNTPLFSVVDLLWKSGLQQGPVIKFLIETLVK